MLIRDYFLQIKNLIIEDLEDDSNFENNAVLDTFKEMVSSLHLKEKYFGIMNLLKSEYRASADRNTDLVTIKTCYADFCKWLSSNIIAAYCWKEEINIGRKSGIGYCMKSLDSLEFESETDKEEFIVRNGVIGVYYYDRMHGEKVVCDYIISFKDTLYADLEEIIGVQLNTEVKENTKGDSIDEHGMEKLPNDPENNNGTTEGLNLPSELDTERAKTLLQKAIQKGLCDSNYKWLKSKALLAYFADRISECLKLGKGEYDGKAKTSWKPFETLFRINGLSGAKRDYQKTGTLPDGHKDVDKLFE